MKPFVYIAFGLFAILSLRCNSQTQSFKENLKWGMKENESVIIPAIYDTIFNFDSTGQVCMACYKVKSASASKFIKVMTTTYVCRYLNKKNEKLVIKNLNNDTSSVFAYTKHALKQYMGNSPFFVVSTKDKKKNLLSKSFKQLTFNGYYDINPSPEPGFYLTHFMNDGDIILAGLINEKEEEIISNNYSTIKMNISDSLIIACSAGVRINADDEVFNYKGKKLLGTFRHLDFATKNYLIHKIFEPKEYYVFYNIATREEKTITADELKLLEHDTILIRQKSDWYVYDLKTNQKTNKEN